MKNEKDSGQPKHYLLAGFLTAHYSDLKKSDIPNHLIKLSPTALAASQRAHQRRVEIEEVEREAKRQKMQGATAEDKSLTILEDVLHVCLEHGSLLDHLDMIEIAWMRLTCKTMAKFAAHLACARLREIPLSFTVMEMCNETMLRAKSVDRWPLARIYHRDDKKENRRNYSSSSSIGKCEDDPRSGQANSFPSKLSATTTELALLRPEGSPHVFSWESGCDGADSESDFRITVVIALEPRRQTKRKLPESEYLCPRSDYLDIVRYRFDPQGRQRDHACPDNRISYNITTSSQNATSAHGFTSEGTFTLQTIKLDFQDLLGVCARKKLPIARHQLQEIRAKRPATRAEKDYVKGLAKESRLASFHVTPVTGMEGW